MTEVFALRTSPATLVADVARAFEQPALASLDPGRPLWIKINGNFNLQYPGSNTSPWFLRALLTVLWQAPGAADAVGLLVDGERVDPGVLELHGHAEPGGARTQDRDPRRRHPHRVDSVDGSVAHSHPRT